MQIWYRNLKKEHHRTASEVAFIALQGGTLSLLSMCMKTKTFFTTLLAIFLGLLNYLPLEAQSEQAPAATPPAGGDFSPLLGIVLMLAVFFFLIILPQSRKAKKHQQFLSGLKKGDQVLTQTGLYGKIYGIADKVITLEISPNVRIRIDRQSIAAYDTITPQAHNEPKAAEG